MSKTYHHIRLLLIAILAFSASGASAQITKSLKFIPATLDFGDIRESRGPVTKSVKAVNISNDSTYIISARTSCGCSEAQYDGRMLAPGDTTTIKVTYDPTNRPGKFLKTVKIFTGEERISNFFHISGNVIPTRQHLSKVYPHQAGDLRLTTNFVAAGDIRPSTSRPYTIGIYNDSNHSIRLQADTDNDALESNIRPDIIEPHGVASLAILLQGHGIGKDIGQFKYNALITDAESGDTIVAIPVTGALKRP